MENDALLKSLLKNAIDGIVTMDEFGVIESINPSACKLFEYSRDEILGKNISILLPTLDKQTQDKYLQRYNTNGNTKQIEIDRERYGVKKSGSHFPMRLGLSELKYEERNIYAGFIHDLSQQKEAEEQLREYAAHLEELVENRTQSLNDSIKDLQQSKAKLSLSLEKEKELSKIKNRFLSMASHELRTPLSTVQLSASLIGKYAETLQAPNILNHVSKIKNAVTNLASMLNNFLYMETLESGILKANFAPFNLSDLGQEITEEMQMLAKKKQKIIYQNRGENSNVNLDKNLIKNGIVNLITNAIKYSGENTTIDFCTEIIENQCVITVHDNGIGIPIQEQMHLFEPFFRAQNTVNISGTGLGLNIVSRYVSLMNGTINFSSSAEDGTLFTLKFPLS